MTKHLQEALKEAARIAVLAALGVVTEALMTGTFSWKVTLGLAAVAALKGVDKWVHSNPDVKAKGLLPF